MRSISSAVNVRRSKTTSLSASVGMAATIFTTASDMLPTLGYAGSGQWTLMEAPASRCVAKSVPRIDARHMSATFRSATSLALLRFCASTTSGSFAA